MPHNFCVTRTVHAFRVTFSWELTHCDTQRETTSMRVSTLTQNVVMVATLIGTSESPSAFGDTLTCRQLFV